MSEKQKMCPVVGTSNLFWPSLLAALMFTWIHNQLPLLTMLLQSEQLRGKSGISVLYLDPRDTKDFR